MIFNDAIFFCKARPTGYEVRAILPTEVVYARTPSIDLYVNVYEGSCVST